MSKHNSHVFAITLELSEHEKAALLTGIVESTHLDNLVMLQAEPLALIEF